MTNHEKNLKKENKKGILFKLNNLLEAIFTAIDLVGKKILGDYWRTVYLSIQDAISLYILLSIPDWIGFLVFGTKFDDFNTCIQINYFQASRYACFIIVISDFLLWILIAGRIIGRFLVELSDLKRRK